MRKICIVLLFALAIWTNAESSPDDTEPEFPICHLAGRWKNQLGSQVLLTETSTPGLYSGSYQTTVESQEGSAGERMTSPASVAVHPTSNQSFSMSVMWDGGSLTTWVGQCYLTSKGIEVLDTTWLLHAPEPSLHDAWKSTRVGKDFFRRKTI